MALFDKVKSLLKSGGSNRLDVSARFNLEQTAINGTMSTFRVAREIKTGKKVGIKFLDQEETQKLESRFASKGLKRPSEGEIGLAMDHPNLVQTYEYGLTTTGQHYIIMQFVEGPSLTALIRDQDSRLIGKRVPLIRQMADAIHAVHEAGYIHRDICPKNFICDTKLEKVTLIDFGVSIPDTPDYRQPGVRTGTPRYMAPEIVRRRETDRRVDLFSLAITAYQFLTFHHPWPGEDTRGTAALAFDTVAFTPIRQYLPDIHNTLADVLESCLASNPDKRPDSIPQFLRLIRKVETETNPG